MDLTNAVSRDVQSKVQQKMYLGSGYGTVVYHVAWNLHEKGLNPVWNWAFFLPLSSEYGSPK